MTIYLFATSLNHRCSIYFATVPDPIFAGTDTMFQSWYHLQSYAFPSFAMVRQVINKWRISMGTVLTLIAPFWRQREWVPDPLGFLLEPPLPLLLRRDLLSQPCFNKYHPNPSMLNLHVWRLSRDLPGPQGSLVEWLDSLQIKKAVFFKIVSDSGLFIGSGVFLRVTLFLTLPFLRLQGFCYGFRR